MSTATAALKQEPGAVAQPPVKKQKVLTLAQEQLAREFQEHYGIDKEQIGFAGEDLSPIFDFDALNTLSLELSDIPSIVVEPGDFNPTIGLATALCTITLRDGRSRMVYGHCLAGELMHDMTVVEDLSAALSVARARALRTGLRSVSFDPVKAHRIRMTNGATASTKFVDVKSNELREGHMLGEELGYIVGDNKVAWRNQLATYFQGKTSMAELSDLERSQWLSMLRSWKQARVRGSESSVADNLLIKDKS